MKRVLFVLTLLIVATAAAGCSLLSSDLPQDQNPPTQNPVNPAPRPSGNVPAPAGACQARLWGKVTNAQGQSGAKIVVDIANGSFKAKTETDANGLYGFAGLCAGEYSFNVTPPNGKAQPTGSPTKLDGSTQVKKLRLGRIVGSHTIFVHVY